MRAAEVQTLSLYHTVLVYQAVADVVIKMVKKQSTLGVVWEPLQLIVVLVFVLSLVGDVPTSTKRHFNRAPYSDTVDIDVNVDVDVAYTVSRK